MKKDIPIFVTGGTGFVGSYILQKLLHQGYRNVKALRRENSPRTMVSSFKDQVAWVEGDVLDVSFLSEHLNGTEWVFHAAAVVSMDFRDYKEMIKTNVEGTANMVNCSLAAGVRKFLHVSSIAALGNPNPGERMVDESTVLEKSGQCDGYAISKYRSEREVWRAIAEGLNAIIVNPSIVLGSGTWKKGSASIFRRIYHGLKFYPTGSSGFVDVRDVARFSVQLMEENIHSERFILSGENWSFQDLLNTIARNFKKKAPNIQINSYIAIMAVLKEWLASRITGSPQQATRTSIKIVQNEIEYDNRKSVDLLNIEYTPIDRTIAETVAQFMQTVPKGLSTARLPPL
jgi:dihydroflavonol-4-reductase